MTDEQTRDELLKMADERLYPSVTNPNYLVLRRRRMIFAKWMASIRGERLAVLDIGGRYQPYRPLLENRIQQYFALDVSSTPFVDAIGTGEQLPFKANTFDLVLATAVFECFPEPKLAAAEIHRTLKPGGYLLMSVAAVCPRAMDDEHWRFLPAGLKFILAPFSRIEIVPEVSSLGGIVRLNAASLSIFAKYGFIRQILHHTVVPVLNLIGLVLEGSGISDNDQVAGNYSALAQK
jgi:SAM-dependent methyltransferase